MSVRTEACGTLTIKAKAPTKMELPPAGQRRGTLLEARFGVKLRRCGSRFAVRLWCEDSDIWKYRAVYVASVRDRLTLSRSYQSPIAHARRTRP
jgi:hypothetical protein